MTSAVAIAEEFKQYAYSVSHDVRAPVRAMVAFSNLLTKEHADSLNEEGKEYLKFIIDSGQKLQAMMDALLEYSRLNTVIKPATYVGVQQIVDESTETLKEQIAKSGAIIEVGELPVVYADAEQMVRLFTILMSNALTYQPQGSTPHIRITCDQIPFYLRFNIYDNGIGVAPEYRDVIFQVFKRLHTDEEYPGVGMGLALAKKIVERHGGTIGCMEATPRGAHFYFTLPIKET